MHCVVIRILNSINSYGILILTFKSWVSALAQLFGALRYKTEGRRLVFDKILKIFSDLILGPGGRLSL